MDQQVEHQQAELQQNYSTVVSELGQEKNLELKRKSRLGVNPKKWTTRTNLHLQQK